MGQTESKTKIDATTLLIIQNQIIEIDKLINISENVKQTQKNFDKELEKRINVQIQTPTNIKKDFNMLQFSLDKSQTDFKEFQRLNKLSEPQKQNTQQLTALLLGTNNQPNIKLNCEIQKQIE